jgi:hypothetical protein
MTRSKVKVDTITTTTTEIITNEQKMTETIAMLELGNHFALQGNSDGFVLASKSATRSFCLCGDYLKATANFARAENAALEQIKKVQDLKKVYEEELRKEMSMKEECEKLLKLSREIKLKVGDAFKQASDVWTSGEW